MREQGVLNFVERLLSAYVVLAPQKRGEDVFIAPLKNSADIDWSGKIPVNTFKKIFLPPREKMFDFSDQTFKPRFEKTAATVALGVNLLDLEALTLLDHVFEKDVYYQKRRQNIFTIGLANGIEADFRKYRVFHRRYEENVLEHVCFDVFIERCRDGQCKIFSGSQKGQQLLEREGITDYEHIEFAGLVPETGSDQRLLENRQAVENNAAHKLWAELAEKCLACGKCTIHCPTCFCFDETDEVGLDGVSKVRQWGSCFFPEFSQMADGEKNLDSLQKKLYFWYVHKFVRIPDELSYFGCVSCLRCVNVCPVGINIAKNLQILKEAIKKHD